VYQFWGKDIYGAGFHHFLPGYYIPTIMKTIRKPWIDEKIHFVGEAYSNLSGWVEGAFQTA
jgi:monoamine oxidase